jgi:ABC-2 type transport system permease protein
MSLAMRDTMVIAKREIMERIKSKWFLVMTVLGPLGIIAMIVVPARLAGRGAEGSKVDIVDATGVIGKPLETALEAVLWKPQIIAADTSDAAELARIHDKTINGYVRVPKDALDGGAIVYQGDNGSSQQVVITLREILRSVVQAERGVRAKIDPAQLVSVLGPVNVETLHTTGETSGTSGMGSFLLAYALALILYIAITLYGVGVMRSIVTEKTSRVMELMVAAVKPQALMAGKILGVGAAGLLQLTVWLGMGALTLAYRDQLLGAFGVHGGGAALPDLGGPEVVIVILYFIFGFFFYASLYAAAGALVSSEQEAQQVQMPVTLIMVVGLTCLNLVSNDPRGGASAVMTMVPFWSPMLMPMRYVLGGASLGQVALSLGILAISTYLVVRVAAKIYRVGILLYGKRPGVRELLRWLRY